MSLCEPHETPDFKQIVDKALSLFAVYTGATLSFYVKDFLFSSGNLAAYHGIGWLGYWGLYATIAVMALLLRYIIGSAVHLNYTYVPTTTQTVGVDGVIASTRAYRSKSVCLIFLDLLFLILFGILAFYITQRTSDIDVVLTDSLYFISAGFLWSLIALFRTEARPIAGIWCVVDFLQIVLTLTILSPLSFLGELGQAIAMAVLYLFFLFLDLFFMVRQMS